MTKYKVLLLLLFTSASIVLAQHRGGGMGGRSMPAIGKISGTVVDSLSGTKIEYANISLLNMKNDEIVDGGVTDSDGQFILRDLKLGRYKLVIEFIGFTQKTIEPIQLFPGEGGGIEQELGIIELSPSSLMLDAVQVVDDAPIYVNEIDKKVFNVSQSSTVTGGSAEDALNTIPNVNVDVDGQVTLRGDSNVTILINGKPSALGGGGLRSSSVENIPADLIEKIEVITSPSAKYDPDGMAGIINIVLKKGMFEGFNGSISSTIGEREKYNVSGNLNYFFNKFNFYTSFTHKDEQRYGNAGWLNDINIIDDSTFIDTYLIETILETQLDSNSCEVDTIISYEPKSFISSNRISKIQKHKINNAITFGSDYEINDKKSISFNLSYNQHNDSSFVNSEVDSTIYSLEQEDDTNYQITQTSTSSLAESEVESGSHFDVLLGYYQNYNKDQHHMSLEIQHSNSQNELTQLENSNNPENSDGFENENKNKTTFNLDYILPLENDNSIEFGVKGTLNNYFSTNSVTYTNDDEDTSKFYNYDLDYSENVFAMYTLSTFNINESLGLMNGLRFEKVDMNMHLQPLNELDSTYFVSVLDTLAYNAINNSPYVPASYFKVFPSLHFLYKIDDKRSLKFGYSLRTERPRLRSLNPTPPFSDTYIRVGNPNLVPEYADKIEVDYSFQEGMKSLSIATYYTNITNMIHWWDKDDYSYNGTIYNKMEPDNIGSAKSFGLELSAGFKPLPFWFAMISTNAWYSKLEELDENTEPDLHGNSFGYFTFLMNKIFLPVVGQVELTARQFNLHTTSGKNTPKIMASLAVKRSFFSERLDMTFKIKNLFDDAGFELEEVISLESHDQTRHLWHSREGRTFYLTLKYNFGELKEKKRRQKKWDRDGSEGGGMGMDF